MAKRINEAILKKHVNPNDNFRVEKLSHIEPIQRPVIDFSKEKEKINYIKEIERLIRSSLEYKKLINFLRSEIDMNYCSFFQGVSSKMANIKIEIHHSPYCLMDLCLIEFNRRQKNGESLSRFQIADTVMKTHFKGMVGLIPLSETVHGLVHDGEIFLPVTYVFGNVSEYYKTYSEFMTPTQKEVLIKNLELFKTMEETPKVLEKRFTYLSVDGMELPHVIF